MDEKVRKSSDLLKTVLGLDPAVKAVFLSGSWAAGAAAPGSDIDFTVLVRHADSIPAVEATIGQVLTPAGHTRGVPEYDFAGARVSISVMPKHDADSWVDHAFVSWEDLLDIQGVLQHKFVEARPVIDPDGVLTGYQRQLAEYPESLADEVVSVSTRYLKDEYVDDWGFRSVFHYSFLLGDILEHVGQAVYARNRRFYMPPLKRLHRDLPSLVPDISDELLELVTLHSADDFTGKLAALKSIVQKLQE